MTTEIVKVNNTPIECPFQEGQHYVAIKPICQALGISHPSQTEVIKNNRKLSSVVSIIETTGSDGKNYSMLCLPLKYIFGWLFTIDENKVKEKARQALIKYKDECYDILFNHFYKKAALYEKRDKAVKYHLGELDQMEQNLGELKQDIKNKKEEIENLRSKPVDQLEIEFANN